MNEETKSKKFEQILEKARSDNRVVGFILTGGRGKGMFTVNSDYDIKVIAIDEAVSEVKGEYRGVQDVIDIGVQSLSEFRSYAAVGSAEEWDRYTFTHIKAQIDKIGEIQKIVDEKGILPKAQVLTTAKNALGAYLNFLYRSIKNRRDGNLLASHFDACESLPWLLTFLFAIEGRIRPYNKFLKWELENYQLKNLPFKSEDFLSKIESVIKSGDIETQKEFHNLAEKVALENNCAEAIEGWKGYYFGRE